MIISVTNYYAKAKLPLKMFLELILSSFFRKFNIMNEQQRPFYSVTRSDICNQYLYLFFSIFFNQDTTTTSGKGSLTLDNDTLSTENSTYYNNKKLESSSTNDALLLYIKIVGGVDVFLSFLYIGICMFDRQIRSNGATNTYVIMPGNNSSYENVDVFFSLEQASTSGIL